MKEISRLRRAARTSCDFHFIAGPAGIVSLARFGVAAGMRAVLVVEGHYSLQHGGASRSPDQNGLGA